jgi:hypothetical protein
VSLACHACSAKRRAEKKLADVDGLYTYVKRH